MSATPVLGALIQLDNGTAANPTLSFYNAPTNGFFLSDSGTIGLSIAGTQVASWNSSGPSVSGDIDLSDGTVALPSLAFTSSQSTGLFYGGSNGLKIATNGVLALTIDSSQNITFVGALASPGVLTLSASSNQLVIKPGANKFTLTAASPAADRVLTIPDPGGAANVLLSVGTNTVSGAYTFSSALSLTAASNQLVINPGAHKFTITGAAPAADRVYTIPDAGSAANFLMSAGAQTISGALTLSGGIVGVVDASNATTGNVGELLSQSRLRSAATGASSTTTLNVTASALALTAGDWDVEAIVGFNPAASTTITRLDAGISTTTAALSATDTIGVPDSTGQVRVVLDMAASAAGGDITMSIVRSRVSISSPTSYFLVAQATFAISTMAVYGSITARRVR